MSKLSKIVRIACVILLFASWIAAMSFVFNGLGEASRDPTFVDWKLMRNLAR